VDSFEILPFFIERKVDISKNLFFCKELWGYPLFLFLSRKNEEGFPHLVTSILQYAISPFPKIFPKKRIWLFLYFILGRVVLGCGFETQARFNEGGPHCYCV